MKNMLRGKKLPSFCVLSEDFIKGGGDPVTQKGSPTNAAAAAAVTKSHGYVTTQEMAALGREVQSRA